jgi:hypothetical protein
MKTGRIMSEPTWIKTGQSTISVKALSLAARKAAATPRLSSVVPLHVTHPPMDFVTVAVPAADALGIGVMTADVFTIGVLAIGGITAGVVITDVLTGCVVTAGFTGGVLTVGVITAGVAIGGVITAGAIVAGPFVADVTTGGVALAVDSPEGGTAATSVPSAVPLSLAPEQADRVPASSNPRRRCVMVNHPKADGSDIMSRSSETMG